MRLLPMVLILLVVGGCTRLELPESPTPSARPTPTPIVDPSLEARPTPTLTPSPAPTPTPIPQAGGELMIGCDTPPFSTAVLDRPAIDELEDHPSAAALRKLLADSRFPGVPASGWWRIARDATTATYLAGRGQVRYYYNLEIGPNGWEYRGDGECEFYPDLTGHAPATWTVDPGFAAPTAESTELHLLVTEYSCASGLPVDDRLLAPAIVYGSDSVFVTFAAIPPPGDAQECPSNPPAPVTVSLREPLGDRLLYGWIPPPDSGG